MVTILQAKREVIELESLRAVVSVWTVDGLTNEKTFTITGIYFQPRSDISTFLQSLERFLSLSSSPHVIAGDLRHF